MVRGQSQVLIRNGQISHDLKRQLVSLWKVDSDQAVKVVNAETDQLLALIGLEKGRGFVIRRVFHY
jgi:tRNA pseudouridine55 synthase